MDTGCLTQERQLSLYIDDRLDDAARQAFEDHLATCEACSEAVAATQELRASVALREAPQAPAFLMDRVMAEIQQRAAAPPAPQGWLQGLLSSVSSMLPALRIAAPLTSGVAACLLIWSLSSTPAQPSPTAASQSSISEQMFFGEDTTSTRQLVQGLADDLDADDDAAANQGG